MARRAEGRGAIVLSARMQPMQRGKLIVDEGRPREGASEQKVSEERAQTLFLCSEYKGVTSGQKINTNLF